jgi:hypothetical protein
MPGEMFSIKLNSRLVASARHMHKVSQIGEDRLGPNKSFEAYLSDLTTVAIVERKQQGRAPAPVNLDRKLSA